MAADRILLEVCVDTPAGLAAAIAGGADRIELCAALALQGLTPAPGLMAIAAQAPIPIYPMIRPRNGDFCYDAGDLDAIRRDIDAVRAYGLAGVVIGANLADGQLDLEALERLVAHSQGLGLTLHRSFDLVPDQAVALEAAIALGFERVLTSGGALTAEAGAEHIAALVEQAAGRIAILAGAGVRPSNVAALVRRTGVREVHGSFGGPVAGADPDSKLGRMGFVPPQLRDTDEAAVAQAVRILREL
jgi:copper homeostasis protein